MAAKSNRWERCRARIWRFTIRGRLWAIRRWLTGCGMCSRMWVVRWSARSQRSLSSTCPRKGEAVMALTLVKEDGTGKADGNSYADVADGDAYFEGHLYATAWTGATSDTKAAALVMATRLIDAQFQFNGFRANEAQALQWPRERCPDPDASRLSASVLGWLGDNFVESDLVPSGVVQATCEMARELIIEDRTAAPPGEG